ncbi:MAG TPA: hypothetical protein VJA86_02550 [Candidatus Nanoarchaeia archaeon]|nr:hypothetical protein [Candidatus Nanoarchaeia archaeon]
MKIKRGGRIKIEHNAGILWVIVTLVVILILLVSYIKMQEREASSNSECESDSGCVLQETGCCPCTMGGKRECMSLENATSYQKILQDCPRDIACIALYNCEFQDCRCQNNRCMGK